MKKAPVTLLASCMAEFLLFTFAILWMQQVN